METPLPDRSKRLHNFSLPCLRWGQQRFLRCVKLHHQHQPPPPTSAPLRPNPSIVESTAAADRSANTNFGCAGEIGAGEGKHRLDQRFSGNVKAMVVSGGGDEDGGARNDAATVRPWNLRTRRAACYEPAREKLAMLVDSSRKHESGVKRRHYEDDGGDYKETSKKGKSRFSVSLLREEIAEDFVAMIGKRPPRRPKKRPRIVQKQLNSLFPGLWLTEEVTADSYNVPEIPET